MPMSDGSSDVCSSHLAFVVSEHLVGRDDLFMFPASTEIDLACHAVNLLAHLVEGGIHAVTLGFSVLGHGVLDSHIWLVEYGDASRRAFDERPASQRSGERRVGKESVSKGRSRG